ncbi:MAG TPA: amidohydrolase family protein [Stellaceae bacterium]
MTDLPIVDGHHHLWRRDDLPWLSGPTAPRIFGPYEAIRRDYPIEEFRADLAGSGVVASVYVQTNWPAGRALDEVAWVQSVADATGWPHAIVGYADLAAPDVATLLDAQMHHPALRGIRQQLHWHANPQYRFAARPDLAADPAWRRGFAELAPRGLLFELQMFAPQMALGADLARAFPDTIIVLEHAGMLADTSAAGWAAWRAGMRKLADCPNVHVKLSGLGTFVHRAAIDDMRPIIRATVDLFGAERCLWGSNFPIEKLWTSYADLVAMVRAVLADFAPADRREILAETAARLYRLGL